jgi:uncharacterized protein YdhG (YjbR/CyaY superfamily)
VAGGLTTVTAYLAAQPPPARLVLERVRATIRKALPGAVEGISYRIPVYKLDGVMVLYFAGFKRHYSLYPATARVVAALGEELAGSLHSKATIHFSYEDPVPTRLIARIAKVRAAEVTELKAARVGASPKRSAKPARTPKAPPRKKPPARAAGPRSRKR